MKAAFVILHYLTASDTLACIESILTVLDDTGATIVVVDNHSANGSQETLQESYGGHERIHFVPLPENLGFAKGNNAGYQYAKHQLGADWIILINNDTLMVQPDFLKRLEREYEMAPFAVLGPDIMTPDGRHQNPKALRGYSSDELARKIRATERNLLLNRLWIYEVLVWWDQMKQKIHSSRNNLPAAPSSSLSEQWQERQENVVLHGSCLILSPLYTANFEGLYDDTFLYCEEEILWTIAQAESMKLVYSPDLKIRHLEDRSTAAQHRNKRKKRLFKLSHELDSLKHLQRIMESEHVPH